jgi:O-antigen/teichoic acid export membrane protein
MIARKSALIIIVQLLNGLIGFIGLKFISYYMTPSEYGIIGFAFGLVSIIAILGSLGFGQAHIKRISEGKDKGRCIGTFSFIKIILAGFVTIVTISSIAFWKYVIGRGFESGLHEQAIYIMLGYFLLHILTSIMTFTFNAKKEIAKAQLPLLSYNIVRIGATIFVAYNGLGVLALAYTYLLGEIFNFSFSLILFKGNPIKKPSKSMINHYYSFAVHMAIVEIAAIIITNIDKVFIQLFWNAQQVGEYFAVYNLSRFVILFSGAIGGLLLPTISEHHSKNNIEEIKILVLKSERYLSMIVFPIILFMVVLAEPIIHILLSDKYYPALPVLQILPFFVLLTVLSSPYQRKFQGMNRPQIARNRVVIMMIVNIFLNLILIPKDINSLGLKMMGLGAQGAAIATVIAYFIGFLYIRIITWKETGIIGSISVIYHLIAAMFVAGIMYLLKTIVYIDRWYEIIGICLFGLACYYTVLFFLKEFKKEDFNLFIDTLNIKKMINYIRDEIGK